MVCGFDSPHKLVALTLIGGSFVGFSACRGPQSSASLSDASTSAANMILIPEYAKTNAVMLDAGGQFLDRDFASEKSGFKKQLGDEYEALVKALAESPDLRLFMYLSHAEDDYQSAGNTTEVEHFKSRILPS